MRIADGLMIVGFSIASVAAAVLVAYVAERRRQGRFAGKTERKLQVIEWTEDSMRLGGERSLRHVDEEER